MTDRTTKLLYWAIAIGLWANVLVPLVRPMTAIAQYQNDYILKNIEARAANIEGSVNAAVAIQNQTNYALNSVDGRLANIDTNIDKLLRGACTNSKLCP